MRGRAVRQDRRQDCSRVRRWPSDIRAPRSLTGIIGVTVTRMITERTFTTCSVTSRDGTTIGYRQVGSGPGLILLHGGMQSSRSFTNLAAALSDAFTVYVPDRRGRGLSGPHGENYGLRSRGHRRTYGRDRRSQYLWPKRGRSYRA